jgi:hypothetical protein
MHGFAGDDSISLAAHGTSMENDVKQLSEGATAVVPEDFHQLSGSTGVR